MRLPFRVKGTALPFRVKGTASEVPNTLSELAQDIARKLGKPLFDPDSLDYLSQEVTRVAKALDRDRPHVPQQRGHGAR